MATRPIKCCLCGNEFKPGADPISGLPNGLGVIMPNGHVYDVCSDCLNTRIVDVQIFIAKSEGEKGQGKLRKCGGKQ